MRLKRRRTTYRTRVRFFFSSLVSRLINYKFARRGRGRDRKREREGKRKKEGEERNPVFRANWKTSSDAGN